MLCWLGDILWINVIYLTITGIAVILKEPLDIFNFIPLIIINFVLLWNSILLRNDPHSGYKKN